jgi:hypothetical protein
MRTKSAKSVVTILLVVIVAVGVMPVPALITAQEPDGTIPAAAWSRAIGEPFENASGVSVGYAMIDDGPLQGAPLGGLGSGTFARTYA